MKMSAALTREYKKSVEKFLDKHFLKLPTNLPGLPAGYRDLAGRRYKEDNYGSITPIADAHPKRDDCLDLQGFSFQYQNLTFNDTIVYCDIDQAEGAEHCEAGFSSEKNKAHANVLPAFFLPWQQNRITFVTLAATGKKIDHFFTSSLSGCAIYITGTPEKPTVYHANARNIGAENEDDKRQKYMDELFRLASINKPLVARLTKSTYQSDERITHKKGKGRVFATNKLGEDRAYKEDTSVVGVRSNKIWKFYYQVNIYMEYTRPDRKLERIRKKRDKEFKGIKSYCNPFPGM